MRAIVFFVQLLLWLLIIRVVVRGVAGLFGPRAPHAPRAARPQAAPRVIEDLLLDRVCRTYVPRSRAVLARVSGRDEAFCSSACRDKALAAVGRAS
jgi:hypothetical protein